jgi:uncharacterized membrane protein
MALHFLDRARPLGLPTLVFLLALALRLYGIGNQSLWYDEGLTVALAQRPPVQIARDAAADVHPPLYYWALHLWIKLFGTSVSAVRSLSALCMAFAAALTFVLARRWFGVPAAVIAGLAAALSPLGVHYGQETRMYALATLLATLMWYALDRGLERAEGRQRAWLVIYTMAALAALFTHYFMAAIVAAAFFAGLLSLCLPPSSTKASPTSPNTPPTSPNAQRPTLNAQRSTPNTPPTSPNAQRPTPNAQRSWFLIHLTLVAAYLPLVWSSRDRLTGWTFAKQPTDPLFILADVLHQFSLGPPSGEHAWPWLAAFALLLAAGLVLPLTQSCNQVITQSRNHAITQSLLPALWLAVPLGAIILLSLGQPYYKPRFLVPILPAFHILVGAGASALISRLLATRRRTQQTTRSASLIPHPSSLIPLLFLIAAAAGPLAREYFDPRVWRDDYRSVAQAIATTAGAGDAVVLVGPGQVEVLDYYLRQPLARYPLPRARPLDPQAATAELERIARSHRRIYAVRYVPYEADPAGVIANWLDTQTFRAGARWYGGVELAHYELGDLTPALRPSDAQFEGGIHLTALAIAPTTARPGDGLRVQMTWQAESLQARDLLLFAHLLDQNGKIVAQFDGPPTATPTSTWQADVPQIGRFAVIIPPGTPPGSYRLVAGLYDPANGARLNIAGADNLTLAALRVAP